MYDVIILGAGPAGLTAAIYGKQARKKTLVLESNTYGGQIINALKVKNYPGFEEISGYDLATKLYNQAKSNDIEIKNEIVNSVINNKDYKEVKTNKNTYKALSVIIATGAKNRKLELDNEDELIGRGVSYCTSCDGMFFKNKVVAVTGGGNSAIDGALYLSNICKKVYVIYRKKEIKTDSENLYSLKNKANVDFILYSTIKSINGKEKLESLTIYNHNINEEKELKIDGLFIEIGHVPVSNIFNGLINIDKNGYIISNESCTTNIDGIFVAGDIRKKEIRQLTTAVSDGTIAMLNACKYLNKKIKN